jgi:hypothetical protein
VLPATARLPGAVNGQKSGNRLSIAVPNAEDKKMIAPIKQYPCPVARCRALYAGASPLPEVFTKLQTVINI